MGSNFRLHPDYSWRYWRDVLYVGYSCHKRGLTREQKTKLQAEFSRIGELLTRYSKTSYVVNKHGFPVVDEDHSLLCWRRFNDAITNLNDDSFHKLAQHQNLTWSLLNDMADRSCLLKMGEWLAARKLTEVAYADHGSRAIVFKARTHGEEAYAVRMDRSHLDFESKTDLDVAWREKHPWMLDRYDVGHFRGDFSNFQLEILPYVQVLTLPNSFSPRSQKKLELLDAKDLILLSWLIYETVRNSPYMGEAYFEVSRLRSLAIMPHGGVAFVDPDKLAYSPGGVPFIRYYRGGKREVVGCLPGRSMRASDDPEKARIKFGYMRRIWKNFALPETLCPLNPDGSWKQHDIWKQKHGLPLSLRPESYCAERGLIREQFVV